MSLFGAMQSGISGLSSQSTSMGAISDNISNVNTVGYKNNNTAFKTLVTTQTSTSYYSPGGVQPVAKQSINAQGLLASNASSTALAVSGNGFFVVNTSANPGGNDTWAYTRAGDFDIDDSGYLKNSANFYLQGWSLLPWDGNEAATVVNIDGINYMKAYYDGSGQTIYINDNIVDSRNLRPINLSTIGGSATPTQQIKYGANLPSGDPVFDPKNEVAGGRHSVSALIYDSLGNASNLNLTYTKDSSNTWGLSTSIPTGAATVTLSGNREATDVDSDVYYAAGQLEFKSIPSNGSTISIKDGQTGKTYTFEFLRSENATVTGTNIGVDIRTGVISTGDFTAKFIEVLKETMPGADRFTDSNGTISIVQSLGGGQLDIDCSKTLACLQTAVNPDESGVPTGRFTIQAIDNALKNVATISFTDTDPANYNGKTFEVNNETFIFDLTDGTGNKINLDDATVGGKIDTVLLAELVATEIRGKITEPERVTASGTTLQFIPSSTGPDLVLNFNGITGLASGTGRDGTTNSFKNMTGSDNITLKNSFAINNGETESGAMAPGIKFNADGTPKYTYVNEMAIEWANGAQNMNGDHGEGTTISLIQGNPGTNDGLTSLSGNFTTNYIKQDGATFGSYAGVNINEQGVVTALYDNGETRPIAILPLATFSNANGMGALSGNVWIETDYSGQALLKMPSSDGAGDIAANSLEQSTVDLASEFSNMIITQRAYSASTKIITTADEMLDELTRMV